MNRRQLPTFSNYKGVTQTMFSSFTELDKALMQTPRAMKTKMFYNDNQKNIVEWKGKTGILNIDAVNEKGEPIPGGILANDFVNYEIIQHKDAFETVGNCLQNIGVKNIKGRLLGYNYGNRQVLEMYLPDVKVKDDTEEGVMVGFQMKNSYDGWSAFSGAMSGYRLICANGMTLRRTISGEIYFNIRHVGKKAIAQESQIKTFVEQCIESSKDLQEYINESMKDTIEWQTAELVMKNLFKGRKKHTEYFVAEAKALAQDKGKKLNRWDLYNLITKFASHGSTKPIGFGLSEFMQQQAERLLVTNSKLLAVPLVDEVTK